MYIKTVTNFSSIQEDNEKQDKEDGESDEEKTYKPKSNFQDSWLQKYNWLEYNPAIIVCMI